MAACEPCPAPITVSVKMTSPGSKRCSRSSSKASCRGNNGGGAQIIQVCQQPCDPMPNYMKPLSRTPSYSARVNIGGGSCCPGHPRPDCCKVPCPQELPPRCPLGIYAERVKSLKPDRKYEPPETKFEGLSTYREHFFMKCADRAASFKPLKTFEPSDAKMEGITTYRETYHCKPVAPPEKPEWAKKGLFQPSDSKMEGITQYRFDYTGCMAPRMPSFKPLKTFVPSDAKLEGVTTYRVNYIPYCPREYDYARPKQFVKPVGSPSCGQMDGITTYRTDYYPKCAVKINSMKPALKPRFSDAKMAGITTYKNDYIPFHFDRCPPNNGVPALLYNELYPDPCMFGCSGDKEVKVEDQDCPDPCPRPAMCPAPGNGSGDSFANGCCDNPFPYTAGNAGEQIRDCCDSLNDPPKEDDNDDC